VQRRRGDRRRETGARHGRQVLAPAPCTAWANIGRTCTPNDSMKKAFAIAALVLGLFGATAVLWRSASPSAARDATEPGLAPTAAAITNSRTETVAHTTLPVASAAEAQTREIPVGHLEAASIADVDALDRDARAGDGRAACLMAAGISRCQQVRLLQRFQQDERSQVDALVRDDTDDNEIERRIDELVGKERLLADAAAGCAGFERAERLTVPRYHVIAANAGHVPSMLATIHPMQMSASAMIRDPGLIEDFRANAATRFRRVLEAGDLRLLMAWFAATHYPEPAPLLDYLPPEWRDPAFVAAIAEQLTPAQRQGQPGLSAFGRTPPIDAETRAAGEALYRRHFAGSAPPALRVAPGSDSLDILRGMLSRDDLDCDQAPTR
jgi:hypothetical protein